MLPLYKNVVSALRNAIGVQLSAEITSHPLVPLPRTHGAALLVRVVSSSRGQRCVRWFGRGKEGYDVQGPAIGGALLSPTGDKHTHTYAA